MSHYWVLGFCVLVMAIGQVLFKQVALYYNAAQTWLDVKVLATLSVAGTLYVLSTVLWIWVLRYLEVSKAYPVFALGFVLVPLAGAWLFGEHLSARYAVGALLIVVGVVLTNT
jgi:drug/metabolite transporter (DMT)-like permease